MINSWGKGLFFYLLDSPLLQEAIAEPYHPEQFSFSISPLFWGKGSCAAASEDLGRSEFTFLSVMIKTWVWTKTALLAFLNDLWLRWDGVNVSMTYLNPNSFWYHWPWYPSGSVQRIWVRECCCAGSPLSFWVDSSWWWLGRRGPSLGLCFVGCHKVWYFLLSLNKHLCVVAEWTHTSHWVRYQYTYDTQFCISIPGK